MSTLNQSSSKAEIIQRSYIEVAKRSQKQDQIRHSPERYRTVKSKVGQNLKVQKSQGKIQAYGATTISDHYFKNFVAQSEGHNVEVTGNEVKVTGGKERSLRDKSPETMSPMRKKALEQNVMRTQQIHDKNHELEQMMEDIEHKKEMHEQFKKTIVDSQETKFAETVEFKTNEVIHEEVVESQQRQDDIVNI